MAKHVIYNAFCSVNAVDLSDHVKTIKYSDGINGVDAAAMSEIQDYAVSKVYQTIHPLEVARTTFNLIVRPDSGAAASTNPQFTVAVFVRGFDVINGTRGDGHMTQAVFAPAGLASISAP